MTRDKAEIIMQVHPAHAVPSWQAPEQFQEDTVRGWFDLCAELGVTTVFWTVNYAGKGTYQSNVLPRMDCLEEGYFEKRGVPGGSAREQFNRMAAALDRFDVLDVALSAAKDYGIRFCCELALFDLYFPGLENDFFEQHPEYWLRGRKRGRPTQMYGQTMPESYQRLTANHADQNVPGQTWFRGIPCYAEPAAQEYWLSVIRELMSRGVENFSFNLISHVQFGCGNTWRVIDGDEGPDSFGFNPPVVAEFQKRFGVDILNEPFESNRLRELHGEFFTGFLRRIRKTIGKDRSLVAGMKMEGHCGFGVDYSQFQFELDWRRWIDERIADGLTVYDSPPDSIEQIRQCVKSGLPESASVYLWRDLIGPQYFPSHRREIEQVRNGALDGFGMKEFAPFCRPETLSWRALFDAGGNDREANVILQRRPTLELQP